MNTEELFIIALCVGAAIALLLIAYGMVLAGYAAKGAITGSGVMNEIRPILNGYE